MQRICQLGDSTEFSCPLGIFLSCFSHEAQAWVVMEPAQVKENFCNDFNRQRIRLQMNWAWLAAVLHLNLILSWCWHFSGHFFSEKSSCWRGQKSKSNFLHNTTHQKKKKKQKQKPGRDQLSVNSFSLHCNRHRKGWLRMKILFSIALLELL